jgi:hypothetical protein
MEHRLIQPEGLDPLHPARIVNSRYVMLAHRSTAVAHPVPKSWGRCSDRGPSSPTRRQISARHARSRTPAAQSPLWFRSRFASGALGGRPHRKGPASQAPRHAANPTYSFTTGSRHQIECGTVVATRPRWRFQWQGPARRHLPLSADQPDDPLSAAPRDNRGHRLRHRRGP